MGGETLTPLKPDPWLKVKGRREGVHYQRSLKGAGAESDVRVMYR